MVREFVDAAEGWYAGGGGAEGGVCIGDGGMDYGAHLRCDRVMGVKGVKQSPVCWT